MTLLSAKQNKTITVGFRHNHTVYPFMNFPWQFERLFVWIYVCIKMCVYFWKCLLCGLLYTTLFVFAISHCFVTFFCCFSFCFLFVDCVLNLTTHYVNQTHPKKNQTKSTSLCGTFEIRRSIVSVYVFWCV